MARQKAKAPALRYHLSGQSVVRIDGVDYYLGPHESPQALARYAVLIATYQKNGYAIPQNFDLRAVEAKAASLMGQSVAETHQADKPILVRHVTASYREHIKTKYANNPTERKRLKQVCDELDHHEGDRKADEFGPLALQRQRQRWIDVGNSRVYCNRLTNAVVRMFKFAVSQELVCNETWQRLKSVEPLRMGQTTAPETQPRGPVAIELVRATAVHLSPIVRDMIRMQVATGLRPSELCNMRPCDIDRSGPVWMFRPTKHKTAGRGKLRAVPIVGDAREAITNYLNRPHEAYCFSPSESVAWWNAKKRVNRKTKVQPSQQNRRKNNPRKAPGERYDATSYRQAIQRAAKAAGVEIWHPYQLRHLVGTVVRDALGVEAAQALLGHAQITMTEHYAKQSERKAIEAANAAPQL